MKTLGIVVFVVGVGLAAWSWPFIGLLVALGGAVVTIAWDK